MDHSLSSVDNANPVSLSVEEIKKRNEARLSGRKKQKNMWVSDWASVAEFVPEEHHGLEPPPSNVPFPNDLRPGVSSISELHNIDREEFDAEEVFDLIRNLTDPEHPLTLEQLSVVSPDLITVNDVQSTVNVQFTPTIPHCSQATLIGLMIRVKLSRCLPSRFKISVGITPGTHNTEDAINKQLNDKERVAAALENPTLLRVINRGVADDGEDIARWPLL